LLELILYSIEAETILIKNNKHMKSNFELGLEEMISSAIKKSVSEAFRNQNQKSNNTPQKKIGKIDLAMEVTGLAKQTIYAKVSKEEIPFIKKNGSLYFSREKLINWLEEGNVNPKTNSYEK
tara:strand:- start:159 stop:524 length:366 start_codon:yes stop_codon:yes gene_type:complete